jgi:hypothetical protein
MPIVFVEAIIEAVEFTPSEIVFSEALEAFI